MRSTVPKNLRYECGFSNPRCEVVCTKKLGQRDSDEEERQIGWEDWFRKINARFVRNSVLAVLY